MGQIINNTIKIYVLGDARKLDFIFKQSYNKGLDVKCVGAGVSKETGNKYLLFILNNHIVDILDEWENRIKQSEFAMEY